MLHVRRKARNAMVTVSIVLAMLLTAMPSADATYRYFNFDYCSWSARTDWSGWTAISETTDQNNNCRYIDADLKYSDNGVHYTQWCSAQITAFLQCNKFGVVQEQALNQAQAEETLHWQSSGWWG